MTIERLRLAIPAVLILILLAIGLRGEKRSPAIAADSRDIFADFEALRTYVREYGPGRTMAQLSQLSSEYGDCHTAAHKAGRFAYEIYGEAAFRECSAECHSGCYHGATEAYFKDHGTANLVRDLNLICSSDLNPFFSHQCLHGIGHGLMAWVDYDLPEALKNCDLLENGRSSCHSGVFMENIVGGLAGENGSDAGIHFTKYLSDDPQFPCNAVAEEYRSACYLLQTSRMMRIFSGDFGKIAAECARAPEAYQPICFQSMGRDAGGIHRGDPAGAIAACSRAEAGSPRLNCLSGAVQDSFWEASGQSDALSFCRSLSDRGEKDMCYSTIFSRALQVLGSGSEVREFCRGAEEDYRESCLRSAP